jgi:hypothetical protein
MARPWIEFVQSQLIPWGDHPIGALRPGAQAKVLSTDDVDGACSLLLRYPAGFAAAAQPLACDEELLVLDGELEIAGVRHGNLAYAHLPAGHAAGAWRSARGAVVLAFYSGQPAAAAAHEYDPARLVAHLDALQVPYTGNFHPQFPPGAGRKILFQDPVSHDTTWLLGTLPLRWAERAEVHPTVEEMYLLAGEVHGNRGIMRPGAYFWRPGAKAHGPYGTQTGNLYLFRTKGGQLSTEYVEPEQPFRWWPDYDPILPAEMQAFRGETASGAGRW